MRSSPFSPSATAPAQPLLERLLGRADPVGAAAALERLVAAEWPSPSRPSVVAVFHDFRVRDDDACNICIALFARALAAFAEDNAISADEADQLHFMRIALALAPRDVQEAHRMVADLLYSAALSRALDEENLTTDERTRLDGLTSHLRTSPDRRGALHRQQAQSILERILGRQSDQRQLSLDEIQTMRAMAGTVGSRADLDDVTQAHFDRFALLWHFERGELPATAVRIKLLTSEICHFYARALWLEASQSAPVPATQRVPPVRVVRGVSHRLDNHPAHGVDATGAAPVDRGTLYITSQRFIFDGPARQVAIRHSDVIALGVYADALLLEKSVGTSPLLAIDGDAALASVIASEAMARSCA